MSAAPYGDDLAFVHATGYGGFAPVGLAVGLGLLAVRALLRDLRAPDSSE